MKKLDLKKIKDKLSTEISSEETLKDVIPIKWSKDILADNKKVIIEGTDKK